MSVSSDGNVHHLFEPDESVIRSHLELLFRRAREVYPEGRCEIAWSDGQGAVTSANTFPITPEGLTEATAIAARHNRSHWNVYVGVNPRKPGTKPYGRCKKDDVEIAFFQFAEIDSAEGADRLRKAPLPYTWAVTTGRRPNPRVHAYWTLEEPVRNLSAWAAQQRALAAGFDGDVMHNADRILRLAGTVSYPDEKKIRNGYQVEKVTLRYVYDDEERPPVSSDTLSRVYPWLKSGDHVDPETGEVHKKPESEQSGPNFSTNGSRVDPEVLLRNIVAGIRRHDNTLSLVAHLVATGHRDWIIREFLTRILPSSEGNTLRQLPEMIQSARIKWGIPDKEEDFSEAATARGPMTIKWYEDIQPSLDASDFVEGLLCSTGLSVVYGESNCGKTFFMTDLAFHIASGRPWRGQQVEKGGVIYVALEGGFGISNRIAALRTYYNSGSERIPFGVVPTSINMLDPAADTGPLIELIKEAANELTVPIRLVVIDTLSRAMGGGNENSPDDMGKIIKSADRIREQTGAHVAFVHHSGKDTAKGARGHSSLRAATDTEIEIVREPEADYSIARVMKQRELEISGEFAFSLKQVVLGMNKRGKPVTSCVVVEADAPEVATRRKRLSDMEFSFLREVRELFARGERIDLVSPERGMTALETVRRSVLTSWLIERGKLDVSGAITVQTGGDGLSQAERQRMYRILSGLENKGFLAGNRDRVWLIK